MTVMSRASLSGCRGLARGSTLPRVGAPYRAETVGSLIRPPYLKEAKARLETGEMSQDEFRAVEDRVGTWADPTIGEAHPANGVRIDRLLDEGLDLVNSIADDIDGVTFAIHLCKGNNTGHYTASGGYEAISRQVFGRLTSYDVFLLEYDDERSGGFEPLSDCPDDKTVVLGLISSKLPQLEDADELARRVNEAARYHPRENLALSTQCGFASVMAGNPQSEDEQRAKLELVADVAHLLWE